MAKAVKFSFRVWVHPDESADIEVWYQGLEPTDDRSRLFTDWIRESISCEDFQSLFDLNKDEHWQVVGTGTIRASYDYQGEYDEEFDVDTFEKQVVPAEWFEDEIALEDHKGDSDEADEAIN